MMINCVGDLKRCGLTDNFKSCPSVLYSGGVCWKLWVIVLSDLLPVPQLIQALDLFGTMAFAVTGAFKAIEHKSDIVGVIILATITGVAGGVLRDIIFGRIPPFAIINPL